MSLPAYSDPFSSPTATAACPLESLPAEATWFDKDSFSHVPPAASSGPAPDFLSTQVTAARRFYLNLKPRQPDELTVVCGGVEECAVDYVVDRSTFPFLSIEFVAAGSGELTLGGRTFALGPGVIFSYGPGVPHRIRTSPGAKLVKYFVDFSGKPCVELLRSCGLEPGASIQIATIGDVREVFDGLVRLGLQSDARTERTCTLQLELLLHTIARSRLLRSASDRRARATFERVREFIDGHFLSVNSVEDVATACHVDSGHLSRQFRRFHNESPLRYLQRRRMQWAADRLQNSSLYVREVADQLGMDQFHFSRTFKRLHGVSPSLFLSARAARGNRE